MTQEEKQLLLKDLCARLSYGVKADGYPWITAECVCGINKDLVNLQGSWVSIENVKPYLRPMYSMTEEEDKEYDKTKDKIAIQWDEYDQPIGYVYADTIKTFEWLIAHHFDFHRLIKKGLALEAPKDMYKQ